MNKQQLRKQLLAARQQLTEEQRNIYDASILYRLIELPELQEAKTIFLYLDFRGEVRTDALLLWGLQQGKTICAPVTKPAEHQMIPVKITSPDDLVLGAYEIREPKFSEDHIVPIEQIDAVVLPGVGFDPQGGRLGYGGGYYDRFLPQLRPHTPKIAIAYELQVIPQVPLEPHDTLLDVLVTEKGVTRMC